MTFSPDYRARAPPHVPTTLVPRPRLRRQLGRVAGPSLPPPPTATYDPAVLLFRRPRGRAPDFLRPEPGQMPTMSIRPSTKTGPNLQPLCLALDCDVARSRPLPPPPTARTTPRSYFSDVSAAAPPISYGHNSANAYDLNSAVNTSRGHYTLLHCFPIRRSNSTPNDP